MADYLQFMTARELCDWTDNQRKANMAKKTVSKLAARLTDMGKPKDILAGMATDAKSIMLGTIYGAANEFVVRATADGMGKTEGLKGTFEIVFSDPEADTIRTSALWLPANFHNLIAPTLRAEGVLAAQFAASVSIVRDTKVPAGFQWGWDFLFDPTAIDPIADLKAEIGRASKNKGK